MTAATPLDITATDAGLTIAGELDAHTAPLLSEAIASFEDGDLRLDMAAVTFVDSSGLRVLIEAHRSAEVDGRNVEIFHPSKSLRRLLEISGVDGHLNIVE